MHLACYQYQSAEAVRLSFTMVSVTVKLTLKLFVSGYYIKNVFIENMHPVLCDMSLPATHGQVLSGICI